MYYGILAASWSLLAGYLGLFSLSHTAFASIGGYTSALLVKWLGIPVLLGMGAGVVMCGALGGAIGWVWLRRSGPPPPGFPRAVPGIGRLAISTEGDGAGGMDGLDTAPL